MFETTNFLKLLPIFLWWFYKDSHEQNTSIKKWEIENDIKFNELLTD